MSEFFTKPFLGNLIGLINSFVILLTLIVLIVYTKATQGMKEQMIVQNKFYQRPIVNLYFRGVGQNRVAYPHFAIRNIGNAPAYNITIDDIQLEEFLFAFDIGEEGEFNNVILEKEKDEKPIIAMGRTKDRQKLTYSNEAMTLLLSKFDLLKEYSDEEYKKSDKRYIAFVVRYKGFDDRIFYSIFKLYQKHPSVTDRIIEFVTTGEGLLKNDDVKNLCEQLPKSVSIFEKMYS